MPQILGLEESKWTMLRHNYSQYILFSKVEKAPEHLSQEIGLVFRGLPEWIVYSPQGREGGTKKALPTLCVLSSLVPQVPWSTCTCPFPLSPQRTKRSTRLQCCGPAKWAPSPTCGGTGTTRRWVMLETARVGPRGSSAQSG